MHPAQSALVVSLFAALAAPTAAQHRWTDVRTLGFEGQAWTDTEAPFDRLPARAKANVRPRVWTLSRHSAGMCVRFRTDATELRVRWSLTEKALDMPHMPATGVSGVDLYVKHDGGWRWLAVAMPTKFPTNESSLVRGLDGEARDYLLYLPLYNGVSKVEIGTPDKAKVSPPRKRKQPKPIVFYGTSITQGGCASRPGMVHTAILGRRLDRPVINLGFSGNGTMDQELADLLAELDAAVFVIDCLPNMQAAQVKQRLEPLVRTLRKKHRKTPILLVEDRTYQNAFLRKDLARRNEASRKALRNGFDKLRSDGVKHLHYLAAGSFLGDDGEGTVDGSHPTDLGFLRQADVFEPAIRKLLR